MGEALARSGHALVFTALVLVARLRDARALRVPAHRALRRAHRGHDRGRARGGAAAAARRSSTPWRRCSSARRSPRPGGSMSTLGHYRSGLDDHLVAGRRRASLPPPRTAPCASGTRPTRSLEHVLAGHDDGVWSATWSPDGRRLVSGGNDGHACLWDAERGKLAAQLEPGGGAIWATGWSPRGDAVRAGLARRRWCASSTARLAAQRGRLAGPHRPGEGPGVLAAAGACSRARATIAASASSISRAARRGSCCSRPRPRGEHGRLHAGRARAW